MGPPFLFAAEAGLTATNLFSVIWRSDVLSASLVTGIVIINIVASRGPFSRAGLGPAPGSSGREASPSGLPGGRRLRQSPQVRGFPHPIDSLPKPGTLATI